MRALGRDPGRFGLEGHMRLERPAEELIADLRCWRDIGATHVALRTTGMGLASVDQHLRALDDARPLIAAAA